MLCFNPSEAAPVIDQLTHMTKCHGHLKPAHTLTNTHTLTNLLTKSFKKGESCCAYPDLVLWSMIISESRVSDALYVLKLQFYVFFFYNWSISVKNFSDVHRWPHVFLIPMPKYCYYCSECSMEIQEVYGEHWYIISMVIYKKLCFSSYLLQKDILFKGVYLRR